MLKFTNVSIICLLLNSQTFFAQCTNIGSNLVAPYASNSSDKGVMFDITATNTVTIFCFDANLPALSNGGYEIYYKTGTYVGSEGTPANWTLAGAADAVQSNGANTPTSLNIPLNLVINSGQTVGFYITANNPVLSTGMLTTSSAGFGTIASDADVTISGGSGVDYPFGTVTVNRSFNGTLHYSTGNVLPVEFTDFMATKVNQSVLLEWRTESEENSDYFEVERSSNGIDWNRLLTTTAAGESTEPKEYQEIDLQPLGGISYYRLSQFDFNGERNILKTVSFNNEVELKNGEILALPNPVIEKVRVFGDKSELENLVVYNSIGQDISSELVITNYDGFTEVNFSNQLQGVFVLRSKTKSRILIKK